MYSLPTWRLEKWVVRKEQTWDWQTLGFAFFVLEWTILSTSDGLTKKSRLHITQDGNLVQVFF